MEGKKVEENMLNIILIREMQIKALLGTSAYPLEWLKWKTDSTGCCKVSETIGTLLCQLEWEMG